MTSMTSVIVTARCAGCGACLLTCPAHAIHPVAGDKSQQFHDHGEEGWGGSVAGTVVVGAALLVRTDRCTACGECIEVCPVDAIEEVVR